MQQNELDRETIKYLRMYGYVIGALAKRDFYYEVIADNFKKEYPYEYYYYIDIDIKKLAEQELINEDRTTREYIKSFKRRFRAAKIQIIKDLYGLEKKGIK